MTPKRRKRVRRRRADYTYVRDTRAFTRDLVAALHGAGAYQPVTKQELVENGTIGSIFEVKIVAEEAPSCQRCLDQGLVLVLPDGTETPYRVPRLRGSRRHEYVVRFCNHSLRT